MKSFFLWGLLCVWLASPAGVRGQWLQQNIELRPGWNAVFLAVDPEPEDCDTLFAGLPVESVWDFNRSLDSAQFVQDPSTLLPGAPGWLTWFPTNHPLSGRGNLFVLRDGRPYLIKLAANASPVTWTVTGRPSLRRITWHPDAVNFVGFHVDAVGPTFQALFAGESGLAGQPVFALDTAGVWRPVANLGVTRPQVGQAYWIRCRLPAQRSGTVEVDCGSRRGLDFIGSAAEQSLRIRNTTSGPRNLSVRLLPSAAPPEGQPLLAGAVPLEFWRADYAGTNFGWAPFTTPLTLTALGAGEEWTIRLGVRRSAASAASAGSQYQSLLEVSDDLGTRWVVPVSADPAGTVLAAGRHTKSNHNELAPAGLWVGEAVLNAVSQPAHPGDASVPRPAGGEFTFRLIIHVDGSGASRLLQHVYLVRKPPIVEPDPENPEFNRIIEAARTVVATDEALISGIVGAGQIVGRRISSAAFAFKQPVALAGGAFGAGTLTGAILLDYDHPLNPFKHVYHPDHDNRDERFEGKLPEGKESFTITRTLAFEFTDNDPLGTQPPAWGDSELGGIYRETISGLHRAALQIRGSFRLQRVASVAALNE